MKSIAFKLFDELLKVP